MTCRPLDDFDHGILSPSGHVSKRTREATIRKMGERVNEAKAAADAEHRAVLQRKRPQFLRQYAAELRRLADRGMRPTIHRRAAARLEAEADALEAKVE